MNKTETAAFKSGYEKAKLDAIDRCKMERLRKTEPGWLTHNVALSFAIEAIRALDVRHALPLREDVMNDDR